MIFATSSLTHGTVQNSQKTCEAFPLASRSCDHPLTYRSHKHGSGFRCHSLQIAWSEKAGIKNGFKASNSKLTKCALALEKLTISPARSYTLNLIYRGVFRHFDGAMQYYTSAEYLEQRDSDLNHNTKHIRHVKARSKKLFKFNCDMQGFSDVRFVFTLLDW